MNSIFKLPLPLSVSKSRKFQSHLSSLCYLCKELGGIEGDVV